MIPPVKWLDGGRKEAWEAGFNARHNLFGIKIWKDLEFAPAILAQEINEWWFLRRWGALMSAPLVALMIWQILEMGVNGALFFLPAFAAFLLGPRLGSLQRRMELVGHAVELIVAVDYMGAEESSYYRDEIKSLQGYSQFKGWSRLEITAAFEKAMPDARAWVDNNASLIRRIVDRS